MARALDHGDGLFPVGTDLFRLVQRRTGHYEGKGVRTLLFADLLPAQGKAVAVHGNHSQLIALHLEQGAGMHRAAFVVADGEQGLADHGAQGFLLNGEGVQVIHHGQLGKLFRVSAQNVELTHATAHIDHIILRREIYDVVGQLSHDLAEQTGRQNKAALLGHIGRNNGTDTGFQIIARQPQHAARLDQNTLQRRDGAFLGHGARGGGYRVLQQRLLTGKFHGVYLLRNGNEMLFLSIRKR